MRLRSQEPQVCIHVSYINLVKSELIIKETSERQVYLTHIKEILVSQVLHELFKF